MSNLRRKGGENGETTAGEDGEIDEFGDRDESGGSLGRIGKYTHAIGEAQLLLQGHPCLRFPSRIFLTSGGDTVGFELGLFCSNLIQTQTTKCSRI
ncbi:hypothetical protein ZOSMA_552G00060 [Zostera marina]|uniref:Uncharacterized protein n=1 Tax=Zostera marina TaxID=29655 RepID=A0A0K9NWB5_ZOSMR|nr:hypothetical protein ZOSMA_552G00060 [Zostera marina]